jgi:hypothetical protein
VRIVRTYHEWQTPNLGLVERATYAVLPDTPPAFERRALELGLTAPTYMESGELRSWC